MNKLLVRTTVNGKERQVEIERGALNFETLKSELQRKTQQKGNWHIRYANKAINNDADLLVAVVEAEKAKEKFLRVDIVGGQAPAKPAPAKPVQQTSASSQPRSVPQQQQQQTSTYTPPPAQQPVSVPVQETGVFKSFVVYGHAGGQEKPKVAATPEGRHYVFRLPPGKTDVTVEVVVATKKLTFNVKSSSGLSSQSFNLPFDFTVNDLQLRGDEVLLAIPGM